MSKKDSQVFQPGAIAEEIEEAVVFKERQD